MKKDTIVFSSVFIVIGVFVFFTASFFPPSAHGVYGPGFFPQVLAAIIILLSIILLLTDKLKSNAGTFYSSDCIRVYKAICFLGAYIALIGTIGFLIVTPFFLFFFMRFLQYKKLGVMIIISVSMTMLLYVIFTVLLFVQLPKGLLF